MIDQSIVSRVKSGMTVGFMAYSKGAAELTFTREISFHKYAGVRLSNFPPVPGGIPPWKRFQWWIFTKLRKRDVRQKSTRLRRPRRDSLIRRMEKLLDRSALTQIVVQDARQ